jgi:endonuclease YncB( thermonuclease family)
MLGRSIAALMVLISQGALAGEILGAAQVVDGDTITIGMERIRLFGIDAPEGKQSCTRDGLSWLCGQEAAKALREKVAGQIVKCDMRDHDRYGRTVAICYLKGEDLNAWLVSEGWALAYKSFSHRYTTEEESARTAKRGLWAGEFLAPWTWRKAIGQ